MSKENPELKEQREEQQPEEQETAQQAEEAKEAQEEPKAAEAEEKEEKKEEDEELQTRYLRLAADFQNFRRRAEKERKDIYAFANEGLVTELLSVLDNFERALAVSEEAAGKGMLEGMQMIFKQLLTVLEKNGLKEIEAQGLDFDPNFHNAVMMTAAEGIESGKVAEVLQKGYTLNGKVLRPSMVKVAE
ncbi:MAG: nucleotide exchange factor GrpE [Clostridiales bacterium]|nr:nucleotide exchange factor GrpE [Clostridiales bacterium]